MTGTFVPFVDPLAIMLIGLAMGTGIGAFYFYYAARGQKDQIESLVYPAVGIGLFDFMSGFYMSFAWPMKTFGTPYNMLFGDPLLMFGLLLIIGAVMVHKNVKLGIMPLLSVLLGIYVLDGAYSISALKLETGQDYITSMGLYIFDAIGAILVPIAYFKPEEGKSGAVKYMYYVEWIILGIGTIFALIIGYLALYGHLHSPP